MGDDGQVGRHSSWYVAEIELAERAADLLWDCTDGDPLPEVLGPVGDVHSFLEAVCEVLRLEDLEDRGRNIPEEQANVALTRLKEAVERFVSWPAARHYQVAAPLAEALEGVGLGWLALELIAGLPMDEGSSPDETQEISASFRRLLPAYVRILIGEETEEDELEVLIRALRQLHDADPDDEELAATLENALLVNAERGRKQVVLEDRRRMVAREPLPKELREVVGQLREFAHDSDLIECSLHLLLADALAAGVLGEGVPPKQVAAAAMAYLIEADLDVAVDLHPFARWAGVSVVKIETIKKRIAAVSDWQPDGGDGPAGDRRKRRWLTEALTFIDLPARWTPYEDPARPPYSTAAAERRLDELREVAWLMVEPAEPVRFVADAFRFGGEAPREMDDEIGVAAIAIWREQCVVDIAGRDNGVDDDGWDGDLDEGWGDDLDDDRGADA